MIRPDYVKCISDTSAGNETKSWCGEEEGFGFRFVSIDHAALNGRNQGRLVACKACTDAIIAALIAGQGEEE